MTSTQPRYHPRRNRTHRPPTSFDEQAQQRNREERERGRTGSAYDASAETDTFEPLHDYDLALQPRGV